MGSFVQILVPGYIKELMEKARKAWSIEAGNVDSSEIWGRTSSTIGLPNLKPLHDDRGTVESSLYGLIKDQADRERVRRPRKSLWRWLND